MSKKTRIHQFLSGTGLFNLKKDVIFALHQGLIKIDDKVIKDKDYQFKLSSSVKYKEKEINLK
jgi:hypothetical protein